MGKIKMALSLFARGVKTHSPLIFVTMGIGCGIAATITACKATTKVESVLDNSREELDNVDYALNHPEDVKDGEIYTAEDADADRKIIKTQTAIGIARTYAVPVILGITSITCILAGYRILHNRNAALTASFNAVTAAFAKYRERVIAEQGEMMDRHFRYGTKLKKKVEVNPETGEETVSYEEELPTSENGFHFIGDINPHLRWDFCADTSTEFRREYSRSAENLTILKSTEDWAKSVLERRGFIFASEIAQELGLELCKDCYTYGWMRPETEEERLNWPDLSIGIREIINMARDEQLINGYDMYHQDSYPIAMNAWSIVDNPVLYTRYRPFAAMCKPGKRLPKMHPNHVYQLYPHNRRAKA